MSDVEKLTVKQCWELLRTVEIGRLAVIVQDHPEIFPVNYAVDRGTIIFRSAKGTKVTSALGDADVAFEADNFDPTTGIVWSVVVKGQASAINRLRDAADSFHHVDVHPWHAGKKERYIRIVPREITGRRFLTMQRANEPPVPQ